MDVDVLYRDGPRHVDEGTGRVRRASHRGGTLPHLDAPVAGLLAEGDAPCGMLLFALLAAPWYAAMLYVHGDAYASAAKTNTVGRFLSPMEGHYGTIFFYLPVLLIGFFPWSALLPVPLYHTFKEWYLIRRARARPDPTGTTELDLFAALWVVSVFVFFTASATRLPHYIGPLFPAAALLTASYWSRGLDNPHTKGIRASIHLMMGVGYLLAIGFACLPTLYTTYADKMVRNSP
jgi:4-amino-4-deoxy-L-arabinose transferase and related glycosyltransferases of PMT family